MRFEVNARLGALAGFREERGLLFAANALGDLSGVIRLRCIAAAMRQAQIFEIGAVGVEPKLNGLNAGAMIMAGGKVEAHRATAATAFVAVSLTQQADASGFRLLAAVLQRAHEPGDRATHEVANNRFGLPPG